MRLRSHIPQLVDFLSKGVDGYQFSFYVVSAAPREVILAALDGIVPSHHIVATELDYDPLSGEVRSIMRVPAGYGKVAAVERLEQELGISPDRTIYVGDGSSTCTSCCTSTIATASRLPSRRTSTCPHRATHGPER